jgi:hypothetical protein
LPERKVRITIVDDAAGRNCAAARGCAADCGIDWSKPGQIDAVRREAFSRFGDRVSVDYIDLPGAKDSPAVRKIESTVRGMPLPVLLADSRPRIAGEFDVRQLMDVIEVGLEEEI